MKYRKDGERAPKFRASRYENEILNNVLYVVKETRERTAERKGIRIDATQSERYLFATLSLFARSPVIVTLYDGGESLLAAGEEFQRLPHFAG